MSSSLTTSNGPSTPPLVVACVGTSQKLVHTAGAWPSQYGLLNRICSSWLTKPAPLFHEQPDFLVCEISHILDCILQVWQCCGGDLLSWGILYMLQGWGYSCLLPTLAIVYIPKIHKDVYYLEFTPNLPECYQTQMLSKIVMCVENPYQCFQGESAVVL